MLDKLFFLLVVGVAVAAAARSHVCAHDDVVRRQQPVVTAPQHYPNQDANQRVR
jgi:hypothetical protein